MNERIEKLEKRIKELETHNRLVFEVLEEIYDNLENHDHDIEELQTKHNELVDGFDSYNERINRVMDKLNTLLRLFKIINL
jgi:uncharacterized coiled-coil protein SlyX